jgi:hypothetical protein
VRTCSTERAACWRKIYMFGVYVPDDRAFDEDLTRPELLSNSCEDARSNGGELSQPVDGFDGEGGGIEFARKLSLLGVIIIGWRAVVGLLLE